MIPDTNIPTVPVNYVTDESRVIYEVVLNEDWDRFPGSSEEPLKAGTIGLVDFYWPNGAPLKLVNRHLPGVKEYATTLKGTPCIGEFDDDWGVHYQQIKSL
jgi:hypothetical protein